MELKYNSFETYMLTKASSNRTFMELKYSNGKVQAIFFNNVLIVPLWN